MPCINRKRRCPSALVLVQFLSVICNNACTFLPPVLHCMQPKPRQFCCILASIHAKNPALFRSLFFHETQNVEQLLNSIAIKNIYRETSSKPLLQRLLFFFFPAEDALYVAFCQLKCLPYIL